MNKFLLLSKLWRTQMETQPIFYLLTSSTEKKKLLPRNNMLFLCSETPKAMIQKSTHHQPLMVYYENPNQMLLPAILVSPHSLMIHTGTFILKTNRNILNPSLLLCTN